MKALAEHGVLLEGIILKPNMVRSGAEAPNQASMADVGYFTLKTLQATIPPAVPGATFLSGGMSEEEATLALNQMNIQAQAAGKLAPWNLSFSYGRALQKTVLQVWQGKDVNIKAAQAALMVRAKANSEAQLGRYMGDAGGAVANESNYKKNYTY